MRQESSLPVSFGESNEDAGAAQSDTSALDYESERIIQDNMKSICRGRTVVIIAHRLSAVREANRIIVMERGRIVEAGSHHELLATPHGHYARLHALQAG